MVFKDTEKLFSYVLLSLFKGLLKIVTSPFQKSENIHLFKKRKCSDIYLNVVYCNLQIGTYFYFLKNDKANGFFEKSELKDLI